MEDYEKIELLLEADIDTLFATVGTLKNSEDLGISLPSKDQLIKYGKDWFQSNKSILMENICSNSVIKSYFISDDYSKEKALELIVMLAGMINNNNNKVIPSIYIAAIIFKIGIKKLCNE